jgi:phospholipase C
VSPPRHVFVLMLENRSFDHMFGYSGVIGLDAMSGAPREVNGVRHELGRNQDPATGVIYTTSPTATYTLGTDVEHEFLDVMLQLCGIARVPANGVLTDGRYPPIDNSGFVSDYIKKFPTGDPALPMRCFAPGTLPVMESLARNFVICDNWFAAHPGPTWPNRFWVHAAAGTGQADSPPESRIAVAMQGSDPFTFPNGLIYDRLLDAGLKYRVYSGDGCPQVRGVEGKHGPVVGEGDISAFEAHVTAPGYDAAYTFIEPDYGPHSFEGLLGCASTLQNDMHPPSNVQSGELLIDRIYIALRRSPLWLQSVFIVLFDEHGGFYDHVPPPRAVPPQDGEKDNTHNFQFDQQGVRVPALICSPLVPAGVVDGTQYDHTSILATVEKLFNLQPLTARDKAANDLLHIFTLTEPRQHAPASLSADGTIEASWVRGASGQAGLMWGESEGAVGYGRRVGVGSEDFKQQAVALTTFDGSRWSTNNSPVGEDWGYDTGRAWVTGANGTCYCRRVGVASPDFSKQALAVTTFKDGAWNTVDSPGGIDWGYTPDQAWVQLNGHPAYCRRVGMPGLDFSQQALAITIFDGTNWTTSVSPGGVDWGYETGRAWITMDNRIAYCRRIGVAGSEFARQGLAVTSFDGMTWSTIVVKGGIDWGYDPDQAWVSSQGRVAYCRRVGIGSNDFKAQSLAVTIFEGETWSTSISPGGIDWGYGTNRIWLVRGGQVIAGTTRDAGGWATNDSPGGVEMGFDTGRAWLATKNQLAYCRRVGIGGADFREQSLAVTIFDGTNWNTGVSPGGIDWGYDIGRMWTLMQGNPAYCRRVGMASEGFARQSLAVTTFTDSDWTTETSGGGVDWGYYD